MVYTCHLHLDDDGQTSIWCLDCGAQWRCATYAEARQAARAHFEGCRPR